MTRAALNLGMTVYGIDPMMRDDFRRHERFVEVDAIDAFCDVEADMYYLALQPNHRTPYLDRLIPEGRAIFSEKPMARAREPEVCDALVDALAHSPATVRYNFLLIFNPITDAILDFFHAHRDVKIASMKSLFEKNRESRRNDRNLKFMEPIQYQESIHSLALMLMLRGEVMRYDVSNFDAVFSGGVIAVGESNLYNAPSSDYDALPDGRFYGTLTASGFRMDVMTNFKRFDHRRFPTRAQKLIEISGEADGHPFHIEADYQREQEMLLINDETVVLPNFEPYAYIWQKVLSQDMPFVRADEHLARFAYRLSALLWDASFTRHERMIEGEEMLAEVALGHRRAFAAGQLPMYRSRPARAWVEKHLIDPVVDIAEGLRGRLAKH